MIIDNKVPKIVISYIATFLVITFSLILTLVFLTDIPKLNVDPLATVRVWLAASNIPLLSALVILYLLVWKSYKDYFYFYIGIHWFILGIQIVFQILVTTKTYQYEVAELHSVLNVLSIFSNAILILAILTPQISPYEISRAFRLFFYWFLITACIYMVFMLTPFQSFAFTVAQAPLSVWSSFIVGRKIEKRFNSTAFSAVASYLKLSFYAWGYLQIAFVGLIIFRQIEHQVTIVENILGLILSFCSFSIKLFNAACILIILNHKYSSPFIQRSIFEELGYLSANLEHDIRNPLAVLSAELYKIKNNIGNEDAYTRITKLEEQTTRISKSVELINTFRVSVDEYQHLLKETNIKSIIDSAIKQIKNDTNDDSITFILDAPETLIANLHKDSFNRAIYHILKNSIEAIHEANRIKGKILIRASVKDEKLPVIVITIEDNGNGIPAENLRKLVDISFSTKHDDNPNHGNGLFMADRIIRRHRGELDFESKQGEKTIAIIRLPALNS